MIQIALLFAAAVIAHYQPLIDYAGPECAAALVQACNTVEAEYGYSVDPCRLASFAKYESGFDAGTVGSAGERGYLQIHPIHRKSMRKLGLDFAVESDRLAYGALLYQWQGDKPWAVRAMARKDYERWFNE